MAGFPEKAKVVIIGLGGIVGASVAHHLIARGWDGVLARYKKNYPDRAAMGQLDFSGLEFHFLGKDAALVLGHWHLTRVQGDIGGVFSLVWQRFPEGWRIIHDHTSEVPSGFTL